jgi:hypothetical protein
MQGVQLSRNPTQYVAMLYLYIHTWLNLTTTQDGNHVSCGEGAVAGRAGVTQ